MLKIIHLAKVRNRNILIGKGVIRVPEAAGVRPKSQAALAARTAVTLIAGIWCREGLLLTADTEELMGDALRTYNEKIHVIRDPSASWHVTLAGAGETDYILMARDLIDEAIKGGKATDKEIIGGIRSSIHEMWRDHARFEREGVSLRLLIGSWSSDERLRFTVVSGAAVRGGRKIEAMGVGDVIFMSLADRFLNQGPLSFVPIDLEAARCFLVYAAQAAKTVPGVGGNTRIVSLSYQGEVKWEKSFKIAAIQEFFADAHSDIRQCISGILDYKNLPAEDLVRKISRKTVARIGKLRKEIALIEADPSLA